MEPDYSWNSGEGNHEHTMWGHVSWTEGKRLNFDEVHEVLEWLREEQEFAIEPKPLPGAELCQTPN